jgi:hypothetical protein
VKVGFELQLVQMLVTSENSIPETGGREAEDDRTRIHFLDRTVFIPMTARSAIPRTIQRQSAQNSQS